jgi:hypothetical protein
MSISGTLLSLASSARPLYQLEESSASELVRHLAHPLFISASATLVGIFIAVVAVRSILRADDRNGGPSARRLMRAMDLTPIDRRLLRRLVRRSDMPNAACLLISRGCFDRASDDADLSDRERARCDDLARRLFADSPNDETAGDAVD